MVDARDAEMQGKWEQMSGRVREAWGALTADDLKQAEGKWERLVGTIRERTGESVDTIERKLNEILDKTKSKS